MSLGTGIALLGAWLPLCAALLGETVNDKGVRDARMTGWAFTALVIMFAYFTK